MGHGASAGWIAGVALSAALAVLACGGQSEHSGGDNGESDDSFGGSSGSASGGASSGGTGLGGSVSTGGISQGGSIAVGGTGSGAGGTSSVGGTGTGGATTCSDCPAMDYGVIVQGDGPTYAMPYNGFIEPAADRAPLPCTESPLRGTVGGCVRSISVSACEGPTSRPPCVEVGSGAVRYVSRDGELFTGWVTSDVPETPSTPGIASGVLTIELTSAVGEALVLTVTYKVCAPLLSNLRIVC